MAISAHETKLIALPVSEIILYVIRYTFPENYHLILAYLKENLKFSFFDSRFFHCFFDWQGSG